MRHWHTQGGLSPIGAPLHADINAQRISPLHLPTGKLGQAENAVASPASSTPSGRTSRAPRGASARALSHEQPSLCAARRQDGHMRRGLLRDLVGPVIVVKEHFRDAK